MRVVVAENPQAVAEYASQIYVGLIQQTSQIVLGLATGSTPIPLYKALIQANRNGALSFQNVATFNLDEYLGLPLGHAQSYRAFMDEHFFKHIDICRSKTFFPASHEDNLDIACEEYEQLITSYGGIDLQLLGIGSNGHIGFNEPSSSLTSRTRVQKLTEETMSHNARFFQLNEFQPNMAITMGIGTIMEARKIVLLATGFSKASAVSKALEHTISPDCPASFIQTHPDALILIDKSAASLLKNTNEYEYI